MMTMVLSLFLLASPTDTHVFLSPKDAQSLIQREDVSVLDARGAGADTDFLPGAVIVAWQKVTPNASTSGLLDSSTARVAKYFEERGVSTKRPVLVYGAAHQGWGEEGRIWWTLKYLGHPKVYILDGGLLGWRNMGFATSKKGAGAKKEGRFRALVDSTYRVRKDVLIEQSGWLAVDARQGDEYDGSTPYGSKRGGHIDGAQHLYWKDFLDSKGFILRRKSAMKKFALAKITRSKPLVVYCTGGVRSAFLLAIMRHFGFDNARNYDGSWWEWSEEGAAQTGD